VNPADYREVSNSTAGGESVSRIEEKGFSVKVFIPRRAIMMQLFLLFFARPIRTENKKKSG